jgi:hypothetical protein
VCWGEEWILQQQESQYWTEKIKKDEKMNDGIHGWMVGGDDDRLYCI